MFAFDKMLSFVNPYFSKTNVPVGVARLAEYDNMMSEVQALLKKHGKKMRTGPIPESFVQIVRQYLHFEPNSADELMYYAQFHKFEGVTTWVYDWYRKWSVIQVTRLEIPKIFQEIKIPYPVYRLHPGMWSWPTHENNEALDAMEKVWKLMNDNIPWLMTEVKRRIRVNHPEYRRYESRWIKSGASD